MVFLVFLGILNLYFANLEISRDSNLVSVTKPKTNWCIFILNTIYVTTYKCHSINVLLLYNSKVLHTGTSIYACKICFEVLMEVAVFQKRYHYYRHFCFLILYRLFLTFYRIPQKLNSEIFSIVLLFLYLASTISFRN